jgi:hypothetical protein
MEKLTKFEQRARECEELAERAPDQAMRDGYRVMAGHWRQLARDRERLMAARKKVQ